MDARAPWGSLTDAASGVYPAPREEVFRAWTEPELVRRWFEPPGVTTESAELDVRPGGAYRIAMRRPPEAPDTYYQVGTYLEVAAPERLVFTFGWEGLPALEVLDGLNELESRVTVLFRDLGESTALSLTHERLRTENLRAFHRWGWGKVLDELDGILPGATRTTERRLR